MTTFTEPMMYHSTYRCQGWVARRRSVTAKDDLLTATAMMAKNSPA